MVEPVRWFLPVVAAGIVVLVAIQWEIRAGRWREDDTRRRLHARAHGVAGHSTPQ